MQVYINNVQIQTVLNGTLEISRRTNGERSCSVSIYDSAPTVKDGDEIEVFMGSEKLFGGIINSVNYSLMTPITSSNPLIQISLSSDGYNFIPSRRIVNVSYTNTTARNIVLAMLSASNLGSDTILAGTVNNGAIIQNYNVSNKSIKSVLDDMASASGYIWYIDDSRQLQFGPGQAVVQSIYSLVYNGTFRDFKNLAWSTSFDNYSNKVNVVGSNFVLTEQDDDEIAERSLEADGQSSGVYGFVIEDSNIISTSQANTVAQNHLSKYAIRQGRLTFESYSSGWQPGTKLIVQIPQITGYSSTPPYLPNIWYYVIEEVGIQKESADIIVYSISAVRRKNANFNTQKSAGFVEYFTNLTKA